MRISTSQIYSTTLSQINNSLTEYMRLNEQSSSQKRINTLSDDAYGAAKVSGLRSEDSCVSSYLENCSVALETLGTADSCLSSVSALITSALETTEQGSTETYNATNLASMAIEIRQCMESIYGITNTKLNDNSIFAGNELEGDAYAGSIGVTLSDGVFDASAVTGVSGTTDSNIWVQFTSAGTIGTDALNALNYRYSKDNGETWTSATLAAGSTTLDFGTCAIELASGTVPEVATAKGEGPGFIIRESYAYTGSSRNMELNISENSPMETTLVGKDIFGGINSSLEDNLFEVLADIAVYMELGKHEGVASCLDKLGACHEVVTAAAASIGAHEIHASYTESHLTLFQEQLTQSISTVEDVDATEILTEISQAEYVYKAVLQTTSNVMGMSLLNYM